MTRQDGVLAGRALVRFLLLMIIVRLVRDTSLRMMYPFLPEYARGLGITLTAAGLLLTVRTALVMLAPFFGNRADRRGQRKMLVVGFVLQAVGLIGFSLASGLWTALFAIIVLGISDSMAHPLQQAYVIEHAPPHRRGRAMASVESSWAISGIVILPIVGWLIAWGGWQLPFRLLSIGSVMAILLFLFVLPPDVPRPRTKPISLWQDVGATLRDRSALTMLLANAGIFMAAETFFVLWGAHLERDFALGPVQIGQVAAIIGAAELGGSVTSSLIIDRTGKRRGVLGGVLIFMALLALMPWLNQTLWSLIIGLAAISMCLEYAIVSAIPLVGQQRPGSRATMLAMGAMVAATGRSFTDAFVVWIFDNIGFMITMLYAFIVLAFAAIALWRWVEERAEQ